MVITFNDLKKNEFSEHQYHSPIFVKHDQKEMLKYLTNDLTFCICHLFRDVIEVVRILPGLVRQSARQDTNYVRELISAAPLGVKFGTHIFSIRTAYVKRIVCMNVWILCDFHPVGILLHSIASYGLDLNHCWDFFYPDLHGNQSVDSLPPPLLVTREIHTLTPIDLPTRSHGNAHIGF